MHDANFYNPPASHSLGTLPYTGRAREKRLLTPYTGGQGGKRFLAIAIPAIQKSPAPPLDAAGRAAP